jgi:hypothetical protein
MKCPNYRQNWREHGHLMIANRLPRAAEKNTLLDERQNLGGLEIGGVINKLLSF